MGTAIIDISIHLQGASNRCVSFAIHELAIANAASIIVFEGLVKRLLIHRKT